MTRMFNKIYKILHQLDQKVLAYVYPLRCPLCDRILNVNQWICQECRKDISYIKEPVCKKCGKPIQHERLEYCDDCERKTHAFTQSKSLWIYEKRVKASVYRFKYQNKREYAKSYAKEMAEKYGSWIRQMGVEVIVPVPLHKSRKRDRGYNQAELLAKELGECLHIPVNTKLLLRVKNTKPQKSVGGMERKNNLKKAFKTTENIVQFKYILVVDDIYTTGSTLDAAAQVLLDAGAIRVYACCISIGRGK